jgi:hypothetical protein
VSERQRKRDEENPMQDLIQIYVGDLNKLRHVFHNELTATVEELSKAMAHFAHRSDAALASFMENASARGLEFEVSATAMLNRFCGLPDVDAGPTLPLKTLTHSDAVRIAVAARRRSRMVCRLGATVDRKPQPAGPVKSGQAA